MRLSLNMMLEWNNVSYDLLPFAVLLLLFVSLLLALWTRNLSYILCFLLFGFYLLIVASLTLFPLQINGYYVEMMRSRAFMEDVNLIPFYFGRFYNSNAALIGLRDNILLTIPFGFGLSFIFPLRARHFLWIIPLGGLSIEALQLAISVVLRYTFRVIDINDVLMNTLGILIGYLAFCIFAWLYRGIIEWFRLRPWGFLNYVYEVAAR